MELALKQKVFRSASWTVLGYGFSQVIRLGSNLVMTRLLVPEMFGVMAIVGMINVVLSLLTDVGLGQNIVQSKRGDDPVFLNTAWSIQVMRGFALCLATVALAFAIHLANAAGFVPAGSVYGSPVLPYVVGVSAITAVFDGFRSTNIAIALRRFDQKKLMLLDLAGQCMALPVMIVAGIATHSIWALVAGAMIASLTSMTLSHIWLDGPGNRFGWDGESVRELARFGKWIAVSSAVGVLTVNGDRLLLGALVPADVLGQYAIAVMMVGAIEGGLNKLFMSVSYPALAETVRKNPARLREIYYRFRFPADIAMLFLAGLLFSAGHLIIDLLYDARDAAAGGMLEVLALSFLVTRYNVAHQIYLAQGMPRYMAVLISARCTALYVAVPTLYVLGGMSAAIWGVALHSFATLPFVYFFNARGGFNDLRRELVVLPALPLGWFSGWAVSHFVVLARQL